MRLLLAAIFLWWGHAHAWEVKQRLAWPDLGNHAAPNVIWDASRDQYVISWYQVMADACHDLMVMTVTAQGQRGPARQVASGCDWFVNWADTPSLAVADNGDWLTFFLRRSKGGDGYDIVMQRSRDAGNSWSRPFLPHTGGAPVQHGFVALAPAGNDRILAVWLDGRGEHEGTAHRAAGQPAQDSSEMGLRSALIGRRGSVSQQALLDARTCSCCQTAIVRTTDNRHVVAYRDRSAGEVRDIAWLVRATDGTWGASQRVHADNWQIHGCPVNGPALAAQASGVAVLWPTMAEQGMSVRLRSLAPAGDMRVLEGGAGVVGRVDLAAFGHGWLASWLGPGEGATASLRLQQLSADGAKLKTTSLATLPASRAVGVPRLASAGEHALLVWSEPVVSESATSGLSLHGALIRNSQ